MDKGRHPHVVRTWTVERLRVPIRTPQPPKMWGRLETRLETCGRLSIGLPGKERNVRVR